MNNKVKLFLLISFIFLIGFFLRFYQLGGIPNSMDWDEVSWGYNAYSVLLTGRDEYGSFLPLSFKAFGDYKQPVYIYSEILPIKVFGLSSLAVRFPSAVYGALSIILIYPLILELFYHNKKKTMLALVGTGIFAVSPWSIQFSRVAFESTLGVFFVFAGLYLFLLGVRKNSTLAFFISAFSFALSAYAYHSEKFFMPFLILLLLIFFRKFFIKRKMFTFLLLVFIFILNSLWILNSTSTARGVSVLFTNQQTQLLENSANAIIYYNQRDDKLGTILNNRRIVYANTFLLNYLKHWDPNWLFITGDLERHHAPGMGLLYLTSLPFIILGLFVMFRDKYENRYLIAGWFLLAPIASAIAIDAPNAERSLIMLPPFIVWEAIGLVAFCNWCNRSSNKQILKKAGLYIVIFIYAFNFLYYVQQYFAHTNLDTEKYWQYGYQQAVEYISKPEFKDKRIIFSSEFEQPYIFYLFYSKYDPSRYIKSGGSSVVNNNCFSIDKHFFGNCEKMLQPGDIFITLKEQPPKAQSKLKTIYYSNQKEAVSIYSISNH